MAVIGTVIPTGNYYLETRNSNMIICTSIIMIIPKNRSIRICNSNFYISSTDTVVLLGIEIVV